MIIKLGTMQAQVESVLFECLSGVKSPRVLCGTCDWLLVYTPVIIIMYVMPFISDLYVQYCIIGFVFHEIGEYSTFAEACVVALMSAHKWMDVEVISNSIIFNDYCCTDGYYKPYSWT
jgi:hypothetical protein